MAMLGYEFDGVEALRAQVPGLLVAHGCSCGCPSISLKVRTDAPGSSVLGTRGLIPVEGFVRPAGNEPGIGILLFVDCTGHMRCLEYVCGVPAKTWPPLEQITFQQGR